METAILIKRIVGYVIVVIAAIAYFAGIIITLGWLPALAIGVILGLIFGFIRLLVWLFYDV